MEKGSDRRLSLKNDHSPAGEIRSRIVMLEFKPITAADGAWARPLLLKADCISCGYTFANLFVWSPVYHTDLARFQDFVIARCFDHPNTPDSPYLYLFPEGDGDKRAAIREIVQDAAVHGKMPRLYSLSQRDKAWLEEQFPGIFAFTSCRGTFDYIYSSEELQNLPGKKNFKRRGTTFPVSCGSIRTLYLSRSLRKTLRRFGPFKQRLESALRQQPGYRNPNGAPCC